MTRIKHETVEVHDITGALRNRLEQVSVRRDARGPAGFRYSHGWRDPNGVAWDLWTREISVENRNLSQAW
jgi:hypothetical protein